MLYLILVHYVRPLDEVDRHMDAHLRFLRAHYDAGDFLLSGRREPRTGGVILARAESSDAVERWLAEDPFHQAGVAAYDVIGWTPTMAAPGWEW